MKRFFSLLLTVAMLLAMIPAVIVGASAEVVNTPSAQTPTTEYTVPKGLSVAWADVVSGSVTYNSSGATVDWSKMSFNHFDTETQQNVASYQGSSTEIVVVGKYNRPTTISQFALRSDYYAGRRNGFKIYLSSDNAETWTEVVSVEGLAHGNKDQVITYTLDSAYATTKWTNVKVTANKTGWAELHGVVALTADNTVDSGATLVGATHYQSFSDKLAPAWNSSMFQVTVKDGTNPAYTSAKLDNPTKIDTIVIHTGIYGSRTRTGKVYASVDGTNWEEIGAIPGTNSNNLCHTLTVASNKAYSYVKVCQGVGYEPYDWSVLRFYVYGTPSGCQVTDTQQKIAQDGLTYAVRFVSKVDSLTDYSAVGYKITATAEGMTTKTWKESSTTVYSSIKALVDGVETTVEAGEGKYYFTATVENISIEQYADVTFVIEAFVVVDGVEMYSAPVTVVFNDGVRV